MNTDMTLAEAIREGAKQHAQGFRCFWKIGRGGAMVSSVLGAAYSGAFGHYLTDAYPHPALRRAFPELEMSFPPCPVCQEARGGLETVVTHLNDDHLWTRETIADWLDTLEDPATEVAPITGGQP